MKATAKKTIRKNRGQGMTEYIIIVALIAIAAIGVITLFGDNVRQLFASSAEALAGNDQVINQGQTAGQSTIKKNLSNFGTNNSY
jgi:pilus assembly protein Flp/PilA